MLKTTFWTYQGQLSCQFNIRVRVLAVIDYVMAYNLQKKRLKIDPAEPKIPNFFYSAHSVAASVALSC